MGKYDKVLLTNIDHKLVDSNMATTAGGWDINRVKMTAQDALKRLEELGYKVQTCLVDLGELMKVLSQTHFHRKNLTALWLVLGHYRNIPFCLRK